MEQTKWIDRWNPISQDVPIVILHHHPCFYSPDPLSDKDMYNCDLAISAISKSLSKYDIQVSLIVFVPLSTKTDQILFYLLIYLINVNEIINFNFEFLEIKYC